MACAHAEYRLHQESLWLAISLFDRFLSARITPNEMIRTIAITCLFIAAKRGWVLGGRGIGEPGRGRGRKGWLTHYTYQSTKCICG